MRTVTEEVKYIQKRTDTFYTMCDRAEKHNSEVGGRESLIYKLKTLIKFCEFFITPRSITSSNKMKSAVYHTVYTLPTFCELKRCNIRNRTTSKPICPLFCDNGKGGMLCGNDHTPGRKIFFESDVDSLAHHPLTYIEVIDRILKKIKALHKRGIL